MRDEFATEDHFHKLILDFTHVREKGLRDIADGTKTERRPGSAQRRYWKCGLDILAAQYSVGVAIDELRPVFP